MRIFNYLLRTGIIIVLCVGRFQSHVQSSVQYLTVSAKINDGNPATCAQRPSISKGSYQLLRGILEDVTSIPSNAPVEQPTSRPSFTVKKKRRRVDIFKNNWGIIIGISLGSIIAIYTGRKIYQYIFGDKQ